MPPIFSKNKKQSVGTPSTAKSVNKKVKRLKPERVHNWYEDRYVAIAVQRNVLFLFSVIASVGVLIALILVKVMYDQRSIDPYLIEVEPVTGITTIVDYQTKKEYTSQEIVKESMLVQYVEAREGYEQKLMEKNTNLVRVMSNKNIYELYLRGMDDSLKEVKKYGSNPNASVKIRSINYLTPTRVQLRFTRRIKAANKVEMKEYKYSVVIGFIFSDLEMGLEDRWINPFGFQVVSYMVQAESMHDES